MVHVRKFKHHAKAEEVEKYNRPIPLIVEKPLYRPMFTIFDFHLFHFIVKGRKCLKPLSLQKDGLLGEKSKKTATFSFCLKESAQIYSVNFKVYLAFKSGHVKDNFLMAFCYYSLLGSCTG